MDDQQNAESSVPNKNNTKTMAIDNCMILPGPGPGGGSPGGPDPTPLFGPRCRLFNIGPKVGPPPGPPSFCL